MTIGVPIVTYLHRVRRIHKALIHQKTVCTWCVKTILYNVLDMLLSSLYLCAIKLRVYYSIKT